MITNLSERYDAVLTFAIIVGVGAFSYALTFALLPVFANG